MIREENILERPPRSSSVNVLMNSAISGSQISLPNRKVVFFLNIFFDLEYEKYFNEKRILLFANLSKVFF
jgi:hypothetical protein